MPIYDFFFQIMPHSFSDSEISILSYSVEPPNPQIAINMTVKVTLLQELQKINPEDK